MLCLLHVLVDCGLSKGRAPSADTVQRTVSALAALSARASLSEEEDVALLAVLTAVARQPQTFSLSVSDASSLLHSALHVASARSPSLATMLQLSRLLCALVERRWELLKGALSSVLAALRRVLNAVPVVERGHEGDGAVLAAEVSRVLVHLTSGPSAALLSHYLPYLLHDWWTLCRTASAHRALPQWQAAMQPALAACMQRLHDHDLSALFLALPPAEKELFKQHTAVFRRSWQYRGE